MSANGVIPPVEFSDLRYDSLAGQWVALALWDGDLDTSTYAIAYANTTGASSFQVAPTGGADISQVQEPPVFGNGRWVAFSFAASGPSVLTTYDLSTGWMSQAPMLDCNCKVMSSPAWSPSLNAFIILLDKEIATSSDGVNWKALTQLTHTPLPYALNDAYAFSPPRPVFNDPVWLYFANSSGQPVQVLVNLANPRQPKSIALPLDVEYDLIQFVRHAGLYWLRCIHTPREQLLQYSNDAYTWQNVSALPPYTNDVLFVTNGYYYVAVGDEGGIYTNSYNWQPVNSRGLPGNYAWVEWLNSGPKVQYAAECMQDLRPISLCVCAYSLFVCTDRLLRVWQRSIW